jgi:hypothetical protein
MYLMVLQYLLYTVYVIIMYVHIYNVIPALVSPLIGVTLQAAPPFIGAQL